MPSNSHGYDTKRFPLTVAQGRVLYHLERIFRSTGHGMREYRAFLEGCAAAGLDADGVATWDTARCIQALQLMEKHARPMAGFRPLDTGWQDFAPGGRFAPIQSLPATWHEDFEAGRMHVFRKAVDGVGVV